ncbi:hypothetical protein ACFQ4K_20925 [Tistrella bauzanensis]
MVHLRHHLRDGAGAGAPRWCRPGSRGLSLFLVELKNPDGSWNGIEVRRLKDKLGTRALPTAELELKDMIGVPVGGIGRGVAKMGGLLNIARLWSSWSGPAGTGHLLALARDYAGRRRVFGSPWPRNRSIWAGSRASPLNMKPCWR